MIFEIIYQITLSSTIPLTTAMIMMDGYRSLYAADRHAQRMMMMMMGQQPRHGRYLED